MLAPTYAAGIPSTILDPHYKFLFYEVPSRRHDSIHTVLNFAHLYYAVDVQEFTGPVYYVHCDMEPWFVVMYSG